MGDILLGVDHQFAVLVEADAEPQMNRRRLFALGSGQFGIEVDVGRDTAGRLLNYFADHDGLILRQPG